MLSFIEKIMNNIKVVSGPSGKTMKLLEAASRDTNACIVCANVADLRKLNTIIAEKSLDVYVMTFGQFINKEFRNTDIKSFYFDDVDKMFKGLAHPKKIKMLSFSTDNVEILNDKEE